MRLASRPQGPRRNLAAVLLGVTLMVSLTGCSFIAGDLADDQVEEIPAALLASDIGIREAGADKAVSGFTYYLSVTIYLDDDELTDSELGAILQIIVDENDLPTDTIVLTVMNSDRESIDVEQIADRLVPGVVVVSSYGDIQITMDGAREIIDAVGSDN
ncbi:MULTISPECIES: hypothetical protein [Microbacterium]|uniref:Lipoprotein n=2 Tax=Microbacterium maritypicum TaxID=33918 RepID=A0AAJ6APN8_MICMQ|nr:MULTISPECIES: hypothetical protein [Microbacterium]EYT57547.1 hypothetical protein D514_0117580 [Microbacterium sp. UCD-TDU]UTT53489.1 hypothetical protein NMQ05_02590 [Microbacterium liquefaciens]WEF21638.1 hypothetical protein PWF71_02890 [Microbacterium liquefaciens]